MNNFNMIYQEMENIVPEKNAIILISRSDDQKAKLDQLRTITSEAGVMYSIMSRSNNKQIIFRKSRVSDIIYIVIGKVKKEEIPDIALEMHEELAKIDNIEGRPVYMEAVENDDNDLILQTLMTLGADVTLYKGCCFKDSKEAGVVARLTEYAEMKTSKLNELKRSKAKKPFAETDKSLIEYSSYQLAATKEFNDSELYVNEDHQYSLDDISTKIADNVLVTGSVGTGKTRNIVTPNIYKAVGSYFICDPKGQLYKCYSDYLKAKGYTSKLIDFTHPERSEGYNPMEYIYSVQDIDKLSAVITNAKRSEGTRADPFWDNMNVALLNSFIAYLFETNAEYKDFGAILELAREAARDENSSDEKKTVFTEKLAEHLKVCPESWAYQQFVLVDSQPNKTFNCILGTLVSKLSKLDTPELRNMMAKKSIDFTEVSMTKTAVFVTVSDTDRTLDDLVNVFFSQALNELCIFADDRCENGRLPIPVRFILDDFATNCRIEEFPRMISSFRSRAISVMLMVQSESQLEHGYGRDGNTIIANCDTYVYLGGNDIPSVERIARRCDVPFEEIASMPIGSCVIFRRGSKPVRTALSDPEFFIQDMLGYRTNNKDKAATK